MNKGSTKLFYVILIAVGAILVLYEQSKTTMQNVYILVVGFAVLMLGLYKTTRLWVGDNKPNTDDTDAIFSEDDEEYKP